MNLLNDINSPVDLRRLSRAQLPLLADELRQFVIDSVSQTGGHLSSNLGTINGNSKGKKWIKKYCSRSRAASALGLTGQSKLSSEL